MALRKQTLDGNMETLLLAVLADGPSYGYQIVNDLNARAQGLLAMGEGTVYPVLHRLEDRGLIDATWRTGDNGRRRKYYRLTPKGRRAQRENLRQWQGLVRVMHDVLRPPPADIANPQGDPA
ncbi:MAG: helix-turn-helix transcriptional regulator [Planctomycetota bacterium]|nr:helix-turn-helix transcriptional regulator [Planctomycetota bacterium]